MIIATCVSIVFVSLAFWHFYMALFPSAGTSGAVPSIEGKPLFMPSTKATLAVGVVLLLFRLGAFVPVLLEPGLGIA